MGKHPKQRPSYTPSQCYLVFVRGTGLHVCKNDITIKFSHFKEKPRAPGPSPSFPYCAVRSAAACPLGSTFHCPDGDVLHQQVEKQTLHVHMRTEGHYKSGRIQILAGYSS